MSPHISAVSEVAFELVRYGIRKLYLLLIHCMHLRSSHPSGALLAYINVCSQFHPAAKISTHQQVFSHLKVGRMKEQKCGWMWGRSYTAHHIVIMTQE